MTSYTQVLGQDWPTAVTIAVDTEFHDTHTLTVQTATRLNADTLAVQVYRSPAVPDVPAEFDQQAYIPDGQYGRVVVHPVRCLTPDLSPVRMFRDLFGLSDLDILNRREGYRRVEEFGRPGVAVPRNVSLNKRTRDWRVPSFNLTVVGHFLTADFCRLWGHQFFTDLLGEDVEIRDRKLIQFANAKGSFKAPVVEFFSWGGGFYKVSVETRDIILPFGHHSLNTLSKTFLGFGKNETLTEQDKQDMDRTFHTRTCDAYGYAMADVLNTLLVHEQMEKHDHDIYRRFGFTEEEIPPLRPTLGGRVSTFLLKATRRAVGPCDALPSDRSVEALMRKGGMGLFKVHPEDSRYGTQTGKVHGGLLYSRSPTKFWHASPGMLRDVDMAGCYQRIISDLDVYWGRPVIFEPGRKGFTLKEAAELAMRYADKDGWFIRVSGDIRGCPNALIPSTDNAVTSANYRRRLRYGKRRASSRRAFHLEALRDPAAVKGTGGSRLYASRIESGVVTWATWLMIQALPPEVRREYEELAAETLVLYPRKLAALNGVEFDDLVEKYRNEELPWEAEIDFDDLQHVRRERIDADYVTMRFPLRDYARQIGEFRQQARDKDGKGSGSELAWKVHANSMYGVLGSSYLPTNNFVAANVITGQARAEAFAMSQALNAIQTITDGCTYRLDQIPACSFAECLRRKPDYPIKRAEDGDGIPFIDPAEIPRDDVGFTEWYRGHVKRFFEVQEGEYDRLFDTHELEHKQTSMSKRVEFDALGCDGAANYLKATLDGDGHWQVEDFAARSYGRESKKVLQEWLVRTYSADCLTELAPLTEDTDLLSFEQARRRTERLLQAGMPEVLYPLRLAYRKVSAYRVFKESAFVFETPEQRAAFLKQAQKFEKKTGAGLELLTLRRGYRGRGQGSLTDLAEELYRFIRGGGDKLTKVLNLNKLKGRLDDLSRPRLAELDTRKKQAEEDLARRVDGKNLDLSRWPTAYLRRAA